MNNTHNLNTCVFDEKHSPAIAGFLFLEESKKFYLTDFMPDKDFLDLLVFRVARDPECLINHIRRIYCCFQEQLSEQLYAALVDLLVVLNKRGKALGMRMVMGARKCLSTEQLNRLLAFLENAKTDIYALQGNRYSVLSKGFIGENHLVQPIRNQQEPDYDPLLLARDCIEYSQLDEAMDVLETAVTEQPDRLELHQELLTLYQSTRDAERFNQMKNKLIASGLHLPDIWQ